MTRPRDPNWMALAGRAVEVTWAELPPAIHEVAVEIPVLLFEKLPQRFLDEGLEPDTLGLFEGGDLGQEDHPGQARIFLFLENLVDFVDGDESRFLEEVRVTLLHELGHLLGLDEDALLNRGLD